METLLPSAVTLSATLALFVTVYRMVQHETDQGGRVVLRRVRAGLDWVCNRVGELAVSTRGRMVTVDADRRARAADANVATLLRHATRTPLTVTYTNNHLSQMHDHKSTTALTPAQGRKLKKKKLEERF